MDDATKDGLKDQAQMHAQRDEVQAGIPLLLSMLLAGLAAALLTRNALSGGIIEWIAMIGVFAVTAHTTGIVYSMAYSRLHARGDDGEQ